MDRDRQRTSVFSDSASKKPQNEDASDLRGVRDELLIQRIRGGETELSRS